MHQGDRTWDIPLSELTTRLKSGETLEEIKCQPTRNEIPVEIRTGGPRRNITKGDRLHHEFLTCGQSILPKCRGCARFEQVRVRIPFVVDGQIFYVKTTNDTGEVVYVPKGRRTIKPMNEDPYTIEVEPQWWNATVGGFCQIPAEGMEKDGRTVYCDPKPKKLKIDNTCGNCEFLDWTDESIQFDGEVNGAARLNRWERFQITQDPNVENIGMALGLALYKKQTKPQGRITWHEVNILNVLERNGRRLWEIQTTEGARKKVRIFDGDERFEIYPNEGKTRGALMVRYPGHKLLDLSLPLTKRVRIWPPLPPKKIRHSTRVPILARPDICDSCKPERSKISRVNGKLKIRVYHAEPCYFHSKAPVYNIVLQEVEFKHQCDTSNIDELLPVAILKVIQIEDGKVLVVDGNGHKPEPYGTEVANAAVFRQQLQRLQDDAKRLTGPSGSQQVFSQYLDVVSKLRYQYRTVTMRPSWLVPSSIEANKPFCSHPDGIDFRKMWQDAFGSERVDRRFDEGDFNKTQVEEEWRAGMRDHSMTPQRLQEEILATEFAHKFYDPNLNAVNVPDSLKVDPPESWTTVQIRGIAGMHDDEGNPVEDPEKFVRMLDERVVIGHVPGEEGDEGPRYLTRRQQSFGYTITRGRYGKRKGSDKTAMSALDPDYIIFGYNPDEDDHFVHDAWYCPECKAAYAHVEDPMDPVCECGASLYRNQRSTTNNPRASGGIGVAISTDSARTQQQHRLWSQVCPHWVLRGSNPPIGIDDLDGFDEDEPVMKHWINRSHIRAKTLDVEVGQLTAEHKAANNTFLEALAEVEAKREAHKKSNEGVSAKELEEMFPTPKLPFYREKIAGSVSKMGGSASSD